MLDSRTFLHRALALLGCAVLVVLAYLPGLSAGFLLDDFENLAPLKRYLDGELSWTGVLLGNQSGPVGRPLSMLSFLAEAEWSGLQPEAFLRTNLALHLICGFLVAVLVRRITRRDPQFAGPWSLSLAIGVALVWALLPLHVSVVMYAVQRMALLSAVFVLAALIVFVVGRQRLSDGRNGWGPLLFVAFPALTAFAMLSKENGALAPLIAAAIELAWFRTTNSTTERRWRVRFFALFLALPILAAVALLLAKPSTFLGAYETRSFTLTERLLTQPRVLWDYVRHIVLPFGPSMGLIHDDYPKSTSLLHPWSTLAAIVAWIVALLIAWRARVRAPAILGGLALFLAAHAMESTILPLELYFEHRNYLASLGTLLVCASLLALIAARVPSPTPAFRRALSASALLLPLALAGATYARASVWGSPEARLAQALATSPTSPRLRSQLAVSAAESGDLEGALEHIEWAASGPAAPPARTLALWKLLSACLAKQPIGDSAVIEAAASASSPRIALTEMVSFEAMAQRIESGRCTWPTASDAIGLGKAMLRNTIQPANAHEVWRVRYNVARLLASSGSIDEAAALAEQAWADSRWNGGVGVLVFQLHASRKDLAACERTLDRFATLDLSRDVALQRAVAQFAEYVRSSKQSSDGSPTQSGGGGSQ